MNSVPTGDDRLRGQLQKWRDELVDLSRRNRLVNLAGSRASSLEITEPGYESVLDGLHTHELGWRFHYPPVADGVVLDPTTQAMLASEDPDLTDELMDDELMTGAPSAGHLSRAIRALERRASQELMDKGLSVTYLAVGALEWVDAAGDELVSPLILVPVQITRGSPRQPFRLVLVDEEPSLNPALAVKLQREFEFELPPFDADELRVAEYIASVRELVDGGAWRVTEQLVLSYFVFHKEAMYRDLVDNEELILEHPLIQALGGVSAGPDDTMVLDLPDDADLDEAAPPEGFASILDADSTQRRCILAARNGKSFVMDGPPGTGKSQTIANIIAELLGQGRSVLFVSEKAAALDVVRERLADKGLGEFVLELHSHKATRKDFAAVMGAALQTRMKVSGAMTQLDLARLSERRRQLSAYATAMNEVRLPLGRSLHTAMGECIALESARRLPRPEIAQPLDAEHLLAVILAASGLSNAWGPVARGDEFLWRDLTDPAVAAADAGEIGRRIEVAIETIRSLAREAANAAALLGLPFPADRPAVDSLVSLLEHLAQRPGPVPSHWLTLDSTGPLVRRAEEMRPLHTEDATLTSGLDVVCPTWRITDDRIRARLGGIVDAIHAIDPRLAPRPDAAVTSLAQSRDISLGWAQMLRWASVEATALLESAGAAAEGPPTVSEIERLGALASLLASRPAAPPQWFVASGLEAARASIDVLQPLVANYRQLRDVVRPHFNDQLDRFDVEELFGGETDLVANLGRLTATGRHNRKNLTACLADGATTDEVIALLPKVREYQAVRERLSAVEGQWVGPLAAAWTDRDSVDLDYASESVSALERTLSIARPNNRQAFLDLLGGQGLDEFTARVGVLVERMAGWRAAAGHLWGSLDDIVDAPLGELAAILDAFATQLASLHSEIAGLRFAKPELLTLEALDEATRAIARCRELETYTTQTAAADQATFGDLYRGTNTDWSSVEAAVVWANEVRRRYTGEITDSVARDLVSIDLGSRGLAELSRQADKCIGEIRSTFLPLQAARLDDDLDLSLESAVELLDELQRSLSDVEEWHSYVECVERLRNLGLGAAVEEMIGQGFRREEIGPAVERAVLAAWVDGVLADDNRLRPLRSSDRDQLIAEFQTLDRQLVQSAVSRIVDRCNARRPQTTVGAAGEIRREAEKKRRHMPIRELVRRSGGLASDLKPCIMMSPLSVSQFLPSEATFDAVIFDEASQVRPCDAANAIYRGRQLIVAGDNRQLPPTSFFARRVETDDDEWEEEQFDEFESLLDLCKASGSIPSLPLRWHYRSRHEDLITYSNRAFYDSKLITFPSAAEVSADLGVEFVHVEDGVYERGGARHNVPEARRVVERVLHYATNHPLLSVGVVALSEAQASRIEIEIELARQGRPDLDEWFAGDRLTGFFVKNLESVQGDERDVILFSIGYGPDEAGKLTMNFGPMNKAGGERRLNVAITRARQRVELISSITESDIRETSSVGTRHLKGYLDFAIHGTSALARGLPESLGDADSPFEEEVLRAIRSWGFEADSQIGQAGYRIDIGVRHPNRPGQFMLGVECDGAAYHSSPVARDRDRLRQEVLEGLGWRMHRIWGTTWYRHRPEAERVLRDALDAAVLGTSPLEPTSSATPAPVKVDAHTVDHGADPTWVIDYSVARLLSLDAGVIDDANRGYDLQSAIIAVVRKEGPVSRSVLGNRLREACGAGRMTAKRQGRLDQVISRLLDVGGVVETEHGFLEVPGFDVSVRRPTDDDSSRRSVGNVAPSEIELAVRLMLGDAKVIEESELRSLVARTFGWARRGPDVEMAIGRAVDRAIASKAGRRLPDGRVEATEDSGVE